MSLIRTSKGLMPEEALRRVDIHEDHDDCEFPHTVHAVEHWDGEELVKRSAHVTIKYGFNLAGDLERF